MTEEQKILVFLYKKIGDMKRSDFSNDEIFNKTSEDLFETLRVYFEDNPID
jgi:hypothetical protein